MMHLRDLQNNRELVNEIDWEMTPEEAVTLYLEWGNNWAHGKYVIRSKNDVSHYFVVYAWEDPPVIFLVRRNSEGAEDIARISLPETLRKKFMRTTGINKGVYAVEGEIREWLQSELRCH